MLTNGHLVWLILFAPLLAAGAILLFTRRLPRVSAVLSIGAVVLGFVLALKVFVDVLQGRPVTPPSVTWLDLGVLQMTWAATVDRLSALMLLVVTGVGAIQRGQVFIFDSAEKPCRPLNLPMVP
jgi:NADH:ubiquinone oxidoreductase subunit 5 (subunit L)/multisubunit Na+/H+ antiporter MnhA subunit